MTMRPDRDQIPPELRASMDETPDRSSGMESVWDALGAVAPAGPVAPSTPEAWDDLSRRIQPERAARPVRPARVEADRPARRSVRRRLPGATRAIGIAVVVLVVAAVFWWRQPVTVRVGPGERTLVSLPDGSTVELNSASGLRYRRGFDVLPFVASAERTVRLEGEAFFTVATDAAHPFVVHAGPARIQVVGTQFNVRSRDMETGARTLVTLREGSVLVSAEGRDGDAVLMDSVGASVVLRTGESPRMMAAAASLDHLLAWRSNGFAAVDEPVGEILREVQRRYSVQLDLHPGLATDSAMTVFYLRGTTAEEIIHDLCLSRGWNYRETSRGYAVFPSNLD